MTYQERRTWAYGVIALVAYLGYAAVLLTSHSQTPLAERPYVTAMLVAIGGSILAGIISGIVVGLLPGHDHATDERDRQLHRAGELVGYGFVVAGAIGALLLAMVEADPFWIANTIYLAFTLSALASSGTAIVGYRRGLPSW